MFAAIWDRVCRYFTPIRVCAACGTRGDAWGMRYTPRGWVCCDPR
jgi:hypothetical protein